MLDAFAKIAGLQRLHELDAVVANAHELHPEALTETRAVVALFGDFGLVPGAGLLFPGENLADPAGEAALLRLDEVTDDLVGAPLFGVEVPAAVVTKGVELGLDEGGGRFEI